MATLTDAQDAPIVFGKYTFPVWPLKDVTVVAARLTANRVEILRKNLGDGIPPREKAYMLAREEQVAAGPLDVFRYLTSLEGVDECLGTSLKRAGVSDGEATAFLDSLRFDTKQELAMRVSHIYEYVPEIPGTTATPPSSTQSGPNKGLGLGDPNQRVPKEPLGLGEVAKNA